MRMYNNLLHGRNFVSPTYGTCTRIFPVVHKKLTVFVQTSKLTQNRDVNIYRKKTLFLRYFYAPFHVDKSIQYPVDKKCDSDSGGIASQNS